MLRLLINLSPRVVIDRFFKLVLLNFNFYWVTITRISSGSSCYFLLLIFLCVFFLKFYWQKLYLKGSYKILQRPADNICATLRTSTQRWINMQQWSQITTSKQQLPVQASCCRIDGNMWWHLHNFVLLATFVCRFNIAHGCCCCGYSNVAFCFLHVL